MEKKLHFRVLFGKIGKMKKILSAAEITDFEKKFHRPIDDLGNWNGDRLVVVLQGKEVQGCVNYFLDKAFGPSGITIENMLSKNRRTSGQFRKKYPNWSIARELIAQLVGFHKANVIVLGHPIQAPGSKMIKKMVNEGLLEGTDAVYQPTKKLKPQIVVRSGRK